MDKVHYSKVKFKHSKENV